MAAVRGLRVSLKAASDPEPMEVEEGELLLPPPPPKEREREEEAEEEEEEQKPPPPPLEEEEEAGGGGGGGASGPLRRALPDTSRRYENKAGSFITGIDVTSKEAMEKKEQRAKRFHFRAEVNLAQRNVALDWDTMKKAIPKLRLDTLYVFGVDEMSTQDIFGYFKEYPPAHIEWLDDASCNVVWLDEVTATRALINMSAMPEEEEEEEEGKAKAQEGGRKDRKEKAEGSSEDEAEEGEVEDDGRSQAEELDTLSQAEEDSLLRNDLRPAVKLAKGNKLFMRFATRDDKKELGAARRSQYYMKYGNPNYGGMKGILSNSWKRRYHSRRLHRDVVKKRALLGDEDVGRTPPYKHHRSGLGNVPEEEEEEEEEEDEQDMEEGEGEGGGGGRVVVEYRDELQAFRRARERSGPPRRPPDPSSSSSSSSSGSDSDEMDYDLELKMISTPSPKKSLKMTMYADEVESQLKSIRNSMRADSVSSGNIKTRIGSKGPPEKKVTDVRRLLEEKRQGGGGTRPPLAPPTGAPKSDVRQRLGKRPHSPEAPPLPPAAPLLLREPLSDVHSRLGVAKQEPPDREREREKKKKKAGALWARLGSAPKAPEKKKAAPPSLEPHEKKAPAPPASSSSAAGFPGLASPEEEDSALQRAWGALIQGKAHSRQQQQQQQKSCLDHLPSLQIEISREESSSGSEADS